ncbi:hypothetical protein EYB26_006431 [Talaromyces marneffei]|uniref:uncharacterized protein n=1 Tax=Talaromyces marneffei TaxID=37727 RepID=UPI0012A79978|nr:uncharacterized protein EYB26_006431 [Talaromyces marneffei]QGA18746.1 hypothetical protein EYB26_006431 [Talaromyces marneffei]
MVNRHGSRKERICPWCSQSFSKDEHLARHIRSHTKEKPFSCPTCRKAFTRHDSLLRHSRSHFEEQQRVRGSQHSAQEDLSSCTADTLSDLLNSAIETGNSRIFQAAATTTTSPFTQSPPSTHGPPATHSLPYEYDSTMGVGAMSSWSGPMDTSNNQFSLLTDNLNRPETANINMTNNWMFSPSQQFPGWLVDEEFDLSALCANIPPSGTSLPMDWASYGFFANDRVQMNYSEANIIIEAPAGIIGESKEEKVKRQWFTYLGPERSGQATPDGSNESTSVDERYREDLSRELQQRRITYEPLPSTDFLNLCIQMYFTRFHPIFPIVHAPTFRPSAKRSLLLISICSVGSLFVGSPYAMVQGNRLFERLNKAILASWEMYFVRGAPDALAMTQAALLGQTFAMLSGNPRHIVLFQTFHGTLIAWARRQNMFDQDMSAMYSSDIQSDVEASWRKWIYNEEKRRVAVGLRIHDTESAELFMTEPFLRFSAATWTISSGELWTAPTSNAWAHALGERKDQNTNFEYSPPLSTDRYERDIPELSSTYPELALYAFLEGMSSQIMERASIQQCLTETSQELTPKLVIIYNSLLRQQLQLDNFSLKALWHSIFILLHCNMNKLECAIGREGCEKAQDHVEYATSWASSVDAHRCAIHAALILRHLQRIPIGQEPGIHVPRLLYRSTLVWYAYTRFGRDGGTASTTNELNFPELNGTGIDTGRVLFAANGFKKSRPTTSESSTLFHLIDLLARLGHWGISQKMASLFSVLVHNHDV